MDNKMEIKKADPFAIGKPIGIGGRKPWEFKARIKF